MPNREIFRQSIVYQGAVAWNELDSAIKFCNTIMSFKHLYKDSTYTYCSYCTFVHIVHHCYFSILGAKVENMLNCNWPTQSKYITINK